MAKKREDRDAAQVCGELFAIAHVKQRHVIELPFGKEAALLGDDGDS